MLKAIGAVRRATLIGDRPGDGKASKAAESGPTVRVAISEDLADEEDFGITPGTLQVITVERSSWNHPHEPPLAISSADASPLIAEFTRSWRVLRLQPPVDGPAKKKELSAEHTLLKNYEPRFTPGDATFPSETPVPRCLQPRVAVEDATAWLISPRVRFALGSIEPLFCRLMLYDLHLGCRISGEFAFTLPASASAHRRPPSRALFYVLPNHSASHLYVVLKVSKVLLGDADMATAPYCNPEKFAADTELQRLAERTADCTRRLGKYQQPIAWGAVALADCGSSGARVGVTLYRQRGTMSDETRLPLIPEAARGLLKEKAMPSVCELEVERIDEQRLEEAKFQLKASLKTLSKDATLKLPTAPMLEVHDPFSIMKAADAPDQQQQDGDDAGEPVDSCPLVYTCREVQPLCPLSAVSSFGLYGSGPLAISYTSAMFLYPLRLDRLPFRNVAVRVQLLQKEVEFVCGMDEFENQNALVVAFYSSDDAVMATAAFSQVTYHQKNPQFEREIKLCLPEQLTMAHHLLFTFYHVHCKKLQPNQQQQELVGCAALPLLSRQGALLEDSEFVLNVIPPSNASKNSTSGGIISMPASYVETVRNSVSGSVSSNSTATLPTESSRISFACRTRTLSSVRSQDASIAALMEPFQSKPLKHLDTPADAQIVTRLRELCRASHDMVRHFFLPVTSFVLAYMRFGLTPEVRQAAFHTLLSVFEKVTSTTSSRSQKPPDAFQIQHNFVAITFDDRVIESCASRIIRGSPPVSPDRRQPQSVLQAVTMEWIRVLNDKSQSEDVVSTKRASLMFSNSLLQMILKAMASPRPTDKTAASKRLLPARVNRDDDLLIEELLLLLIEHTTSNAVAGGLLFQKEVNLSIARFCRGLFLVTKSALPIRIISYFLDWTQRLQEDVNVTFHIVFPFLNTLIEFEFFAIVNGFQSPEQSGGRRGAWLARLLFERLLKVADEQVEDRIRADALRLLRRMFVAQVYNPRHQTPEHQELIALMFFPMIPSVARFTTDGKLLATSAAHANQVDSVDTERASYRKELLVCVAHLLSSVTLPYVSWYFRQSAFVVGENTVARGSSDASVSLSPTASLLHYRKLVEETKERAADSRRQSVIQRTLDKAFASAAASNRISAYDEVRVHACLSLVRQIIEVFLVDDASMPSSAASAAASLHILSPDLASRDPRISLLELEAHMRNRRSRHRAGSVGQDAVISIAHRASAAAGSKSPLSKHAPSGRSFTSAASASASPLGTPRLTNQKSLPRNWGKNYVNAQQQQQQQRVSLSGSEDTAKSFSGSGGASTSNSSRRTCDDVEAVDPGDEFETHTRNLHRIVADTVLKALRTAVDQFEWVLRTIEAPLDYRTNTRRNKVREQVSLDQAFSLLGSLVDVFFLLLKRASGIDCLCSVLENEVGDDNDDAKDDDDDCFLADLFHHLQAFLLRFQKALFATRVAGLPLIHDQSRVFLLVSLSATAKLASVRQLASAFLCRLVRVCYDQTGSFLLIKRPILKAFCANFFSSSVLQIPLESLREAIDSWRQQGSSSTDQDGQDQQDADDYTFELQFEELLNGLASQLKIFETWFTAVRTTEAASDQPGGLDWEDLEEGLYRVVHSVSPMWLLDVKTQWMDALIELHVARKQFAEATCCTLEKITFHQEEPKGTSGPQPWLVVELRNAVEFAQQAQWTEQVVEIQERLLLTLRRLRRLVEYRETLRGLDAAIQQLADSQASSALTPGNAFSFYRVVFAGDCVPMSVSRLEFVYKRSKFVSLGEFVGDMKAVLRARFPMCERVDILAESKPLPALERHPNVVFLRVTNVECRSETASNQDTDASDGSATFSFSTPFVAGSSLSYSRTSEQMKRVTLLTTAKPFPCTTSRQVVVRRREVVRCPIDNAMDDIRKRCGLLQHEIANERRGQTDLKTLTLVLKGSVDTHVHGGIPEVIDAFLTLSTSPQNNEFPALLDCDGSAMDEGKSLDKREELADLLVEFLELCWVCLLISRRAFRRSSGNQSHLTENVGLGSGGGGGSVNRQLFNNGSGSSSTTTAPGGSSSSGSYVSRVLLSLGLPLRLLSEDEECFSPLQIEFDKSFSLLVAQLHDRGTSFAYPRDGDLQALYDHLNAKQPSRRPTASLPSASSVPPPPPSSVSSIVVMPPPPPPVASSTSIT